eukprot:TRINITY_DN6587_c0_g1_i1.p2 TRINITY_DN6587_c0_g1~~TRINITY_DN6587_c0_g1_i1.p2  ORF type:complete len:194 (-),score=49.83 TRINITY_DN6587_c0_g1_i1:1335-1916(-)
MSVPYEEAISNLQSMFENVDREVICSVLEENQGHMERTVEILLGMTGDPQIVQEISADDATVSQQIMSDEQYAMMLQDAAFVQQARKHPEFSDILTNDYETDITEDLKKLGQAAKFKIKELYAKWTSPSSSSGYNAVSNDDKSPLTSLQQENNLDVDDVDDADEIPLESKKKTESVVTPSGLTHRHRNKIEED